VKIDEKAFRRQARDVINAVWDETEAWQHPAADGVWRRWLGRLMDDIHDGWKLTTAHIRRRLRETIKELS
jgi:hypothetical protein